MQGQWCDFLRIIIYCFTWKRTRFLLRIFPLISSFFFLSIFKYQKISSLFSQGLRGTQSWNLVHTWPVGWYIMFTWIRLLVFIYSFSFLSLKFQNIKFFVTLSCEAYKVETWYRHGQRVDLLRTPNTSSQKILVPLFSSFFCLSN